MEESIRQALDQLVPMVTAYGLNVLGAIAVLVIGWMVAGWASKAVDRGLGRVKTVDTMLRGFFTSITYYAILGVTFVAVLDRFGVETTSLIAVFGAAGLAIGLALQGTLSNVAAGVMLLLFRPFKVGDFIEGGGLSGTIKNVGLFVTEYATSDNVKIIVPNSQIWGSAIKNYSANPTRRVDFVFAIGYDDDINQAMDIIRGLAAADTRIHADPEPMVVVGELGDSSVNLITRVWSETDNYWKIKFDMTKAVKESFDNQGISIPFPQRDIHIIQQAAE